MRCALYKTDPTGDLRRCHRREGHPGRHRAWYRHDWHYHLLEWLG